MATIYWMRLDLRLSDNPALRAALDRGGAVIPVFIWAPEEEAPWEPGGASRWWLRQSLRALDADLQNRGSRLIVRRGPTERALRALLDETGADAVLWNRRYEPAVTKRDAAIKSTLRENDFAAHSYNSHLLFEPSAIETKTGKPYQVFTPFWKACVAKGDVADPLPAPRKIAAPQSWPDSLAIDDLGLEPTIDWAGGLRAEWTPGEAGAHGRLDAFLDGPVDRYANDRNLPDRVGSSRLSPHLHFGEIGPRQVWRAMLEAAGAGEPRALGKTASTYLSEIGWREFAHHLLVHFPHTTDAPLREKYQNLPWRVAPKDLRRWQKGRTGIPIVDAGMRELWATGWMHNRVRMIVASLLTKNMMIHWLEGARWFWDTLVDADLASNTLGWQWTAGCGADAAPYFRIFNPVTQGEKFDPEAKYVRRWLPELSYLEDKRIHAPWEAPPLELTEANIELGESYPEPIVDLKATRRRALDAFQEIK